MADPFANQTAERARRASLDARAFKAIYRWGRAAPVLLVCAMGACSADAPQPQAAPSPSVPSATLPTASVAQAGSLAQPAAPMPMNTGGTNAVRAPMVSPAAATPSPPREAASTPPPSAAPVSTPALANGIVPCNVSKVVATNCQGCHGATPIGGAPMALMTHADFHKPAVTQPSMKVYQLAKLRIHDKMRLMPPAATMSAADTSTLDAWFDGGALSGASSETNCVVTPASATAAANPGTGDGSYGPLTPGPGETCYEFKVHQSTTSVDDQPYDVGSGEHYEQFYYKAPWPDGSIGTGYATINDNKQVLHHWLLFSSDENQPEGFHITTPLPTLAGTNPMLLAGWALGAPNQVPPKDVGFQLPAHGKQLNVQWHFYNSTGQRQVDASRIQVCTAPKGSRKNIGNITWLGTENLNGNVWFGGAGMPPHKESTFKGTCKPGRAGMAANEPIHIMLFEPHMHRIGTRMKTEVRHMDGSLETIFDKPFSFGSQNHYYVSYDLLPGEQLVTSCSFNNTNSFGVPFGESTDAEMCYQFTLAWPAGALANHAASLIGVTDTCW